MDDIKTMFGTANKFDLKMLVYGAPKCGKTHFAGTYTKGPIRSFSFDPGGHRTLLKSSNEDIQVSEYKSGTTSGKRPTAWEDFLQEVRQLNAEGFFEELAEQSGLVLLESTTTMADAIMDYVQYAKGTLWKGDTKNPPTQPEWGQAGIIMKTWIQHFMAAPCAVMFTAHTRTDKDEISGEMFGFPTTTGKKLGPTQGLYFDEIYYMKPQGSRFYLYTRTPTIFQAGTRLDLPDKIENPSLDKIYKVVVEGDAYDPKG